MASLDSFKCRRRFKVGTRQYSYMSFAAAEKAGLRDITRLPPAERLAEERRFNALMIAPAAK